MNDSRQNPYIGPRSFQEDDSDRFFGRDIEGRQLTSLIIAHRVVLFYAQSGAGKTSLLQASVVPALKQRRMVGVLPVTRVGGDLPPGVAANGVKNIYVYNALLNLEKTAAPQEALLDLTLTAGLAPHLQPENEGQRPHPHLLILDQFEELFTYHPERYHERADFFSQLRECLEAYPYLSMLLSMREEHIAELDFYAAQLPDRLRTRYRIEFMTRDSAMEAIKEPASQAGRPFEEGVAEELVDNLRRIQVSRAAEVAGADGVSTGKFVEPVHLQIVCHQLWESLPEDRGTIRSEDVRAFGNVDQALALFYEQVIKNVSRQAGISQRRLRSWFDEQLITPAQTRGLVFSGERETAGLANEVVERLNRAYLIRSEIRHGAPWYELSHDRFIAPIQRSNQEWRAARQASLIRTVIGASLVILLVVIAAGFLTRQSLVTEASASARSTNVALGATATQSAANAQTTATESAVQAQATTTQSAAQAQAAVTQSAAKAQATTTQSALQAQAIATQSAAQAQATASASAAESSDLAISAARSRVRPLRPGLSVSGENSSAGTIGGFALGQDNQIYLLAQNVVLGSPDCEINAAVVQPGRIDGGRVSEDVIGSVARCLPPQEEGPISQLMGLAQLERGTAFETSIPGLGALRGIRRATPGAAVRMLGRSSGLVSGEITEVAANISMPLPDGTTYQFTNAILTTPMSAGGDGGALVVDEEGYAIGIMVAGSPAASVLAPIGDILDTLGVTLLQPGTQLASLESQSPVLHTAWSPDGTLLASGHENRDILLWDVATGRTLPALRQHTDAATRVTWSPDGHLLASGSWDGDVILWDVTTGQPLEILDEHTDVVESLAWSPDGRLLAAGSRDGTIYLWDTDTGALAARLQGHILAVLSLAFSPDGQVLASGGMDGTLRLWAVSGPGQPAQDVDMLGTNLGAVYSLAFSPDGRLASGLEDGAIIVRDLAFERFTQTLPGHSDRVTSVAWSPDGRLASGSWDGQVILWDLQNDMPARILEGEGEAPAGLAWWLGTQPGLGSVPMLNVGDSWLARPDPVLDEPVPTEDSRSIRSVAWSPDGSRLAAAGNDGVINIWLMK